MIVYKITHVKSGLIYIGKSGGNLAARMKQHKRLLERGKHHCKKLQELYDIDHRLTSKVIEEHRRPEKAHEREQELIGANWKIVLNSKISPAYADIPYEDTSNVTDIYGSPIDEVFPEHKNGPLAHIRAEYIRTAKRLDRYKVTR